MSSFFARMSAGCRVVLNKRREISAGAGQYGTMRGLRSGGVVETVGGGGRLRMPDARREGALEAARAAPVGGGCGRRGRFAKRTLCDVGDQPARRRVSASSGRGAGVFGSGWAWLSVDGGKGLVLDRPPTRSPLLRATSAAGHRCVGARYYLKTRTAGR